MSHNDRPDLIYKFSGRRFSEKRIQGILRRAKSCIQYKACHQAAAPSIDTNACHMGHSHGDQNRRCRDGIAHTVHSRRFHGLRLDLFADCPIVKAHVSLYTDGDHKDPHRQSACLHRLRMKDLLYGSFEKLDSHENDDHGNSKSGDILDAPVSKGVIRVSLHAGKFKSHKRYKG